MLFSDTVMSLVWVSKWGSFSQQRNAWSFREELLVRTYTPTVIHEQLGRGQRILLVLRTLLFLCFPLSYTFSLRISQHLKQEFLDSIFGALESPSMNCPLWRGFRHLLSQLVYPPPIGCISIKRSRQSCRPCEG